MSTVAAFVLFTLYAPVGAFGDIAVGERRAGFDRPGRSAILGLLAGALGLDRRDEQAQAALDAGFDLILRVEAPGRLLMDYHTVQAPRARKGARWPSRRAALAEPDLETLLSLRDYRLDPLCTVALAGRDATADEAVAQWAAAMARPYFVPYLGRKSCPLGLPLRATLVTASDLASAFAHYDAARTEPEVAVRRQLRLADDPSWYADEGAVSRGLLGTGFRPVRREQRRDQVHSRQRWQFGLRQEWLITPIVTPVEAAP